MEGLIHGGAYFRNFTVCLLSSWISIFPWEIYQIIEVYSHLRQLEHLSASHIDDSYLQGDDYEDCEQNVRDTIKLFDSLGFTIHPEKSSFVPKRQLTFVGFIKDAITMTVYPTSEKLEKIIYTCQGLLERPHPLIREVASTG